MERKGRKNKTITADLRDTQPHFSSSLCGVSKGRTDAPKPSVFAGAHSWPQGIFMGVGYKKKEILLIYTQISGVFLDLASTGKMMVSSRKEKNGEKQYLTPQIYVKQVYQPVEIPMCSRSAPVAVRTLI